MIPLKLEMFSEELAEELPYDPDEERQEALRKQSFEDGYQVGRQDAVQEYERESDRILEDITRSLQDLEFTFHDARAGVLKSLAPLFEDVVTSLLPKLARETLPHLIAEVLLPLVEKVTELPIEVLVHPTARLDVERHFANVPSLPVVFLEQDYQPKGQVMLRFGERETRVDTDAAIASISQILRSYFDFPAKEVHRG